MKKLIVGILAVQMVILMALGIPAGGAANAVWKDDQSGIIVNQSNPRNTVESYFHLMDHESYDTAVLLFGPAVHDNINADLLKASQEYNGMVNAKLVKVVPSGEVGNYAVAGLIQILEAAPEQPAISLIVLKQREGKWEIVQDLEQADIKDVKQVFERAMEVCQSIAKEPFPTLTDTQKSNILIQAEMGGQYIEGNLAQLNAMIEN
jgi:hypothetical protein